jgi:hypothetical protein
MKSGKIISSVLIATMLVLFISISAVAAHQPRLETGINTSMSNPIIIENPETSQAFYSILHGSPDYYKISSDVPFKFYLNLLVPQSPGIPADFVSAQLLDTNGNILQTLNGTNSTWSPYFEEFGGDYYLKGPEFTEQLPAGTYYIKIFNAANQGKYNIAVGDIESFPLDESLKALITIPILKQQFFGKPVTKLFIEFLGLILALGSTMVLYLMLIKARKSEEMTQLTIKVHSLLKPVIWVGILITAALWFYVMYKDPSNIVGIVNSLIFVVILLLSWYTGKKLASIQLNKLPIFSMSLLVVLWWLFVYVSIAII